MLPPCSSTSSNGSQKQEIMDKKITWTQEEYSNNFIGEVEGLPMKFELVRELLPNGSKETRIEWQPIIGDISLQDASSECYKKMNIAPRTPDIEKAKESCEEFIKNVWEPKQTFCIEVEVDPFLYKAEPLIKWDQMDGNIHEQRITGRIGVSFERTGQSMPVLFSMKRVPGSALFSPAYINLKVNANPLNGVVDDYIDITPEFGLDSFEQGRYYAEKYLRNHLQVTWEKTSPLEMYHGNLGSHDIVWVHGAGCHVGKKKYGRTSATFAIYPDSASSYKAVFSDFGKEATIVEDATLKECYISCTRFIDENLL